MSDDARNPDELPWSGERFVPQVTGSLRLEHLHRYLLAREYSRGRHVLDIACGEGYGSALLAAVAERVIGVDIAPDAVAHARRRYFRSNLHFCVGNCAAVPLPDRSVDVVVTFETIEHHDQHGAMLREIKRVLKQDGTLIISSPERREYSDVPGYRNPFHVRELYRNEFEDLLRGHFRHVSLAGQRIKAGSLIWPIEAGDSRAFSGYEAGESNGDVRPIGAPLYLLAAASDEPLPPLPVGLLDGGVFVWAADHVNALQSAQAQLSALESSVTALAAERSRLERALSTADGPLRQAVVDYDRRLAAASHEHERLDDALATMTRERDRLFAALGELTAERDNQAAQLRAIERGRSWRLTAPFRSLRRAVQHLQRRS